MAENEGGGARDMSGPQRLPSGNLLVPTSYDDGENLGDGMAEMGPEHPDYVEWLPFVETEVREDADFESKHPRDAEGQFADKGGGDEDGPPGAPDDPEVRPPDFGAARRLLRDVASKHEFAPGPVGPRKTVTLSVWGGTRDARDQPIMQPLTRRLTISPPLHGIHGDKGHPIFRVTVRDETEARAPTERWFDLQTASKLDAFLADATTQPDLAGWPKSRARMPVGRGRTMR